MQAIEVRLLPDHRIDSHSQFKSSRQCAYDVSWNKNKKNTINGLLRNVYLLLAIISMANESIGNFLFKPIVLILVEQGNRMNFYNIGA